MVIQRIQTLFLLIATACMCGFCFSNLGSNSPEDIIAVADKELYLFPAVVSSLLSFIAIFLYKKASLQIRCTVVAEIIGTVLLVLDLFGVGYEALNLGYSAPVLLAVSVIFNFMAVRGIKKDRRLLADSNRLR